MKINDIVEVHDGSYNITLVKGVMSHFGCIHRSRRFRVLSCSGAYPTDRANTRCGTNDLMLVDEKDPDFVLFSQERFCRVTAPTPTPPVPELMKIPVPHGTKEVRLILQ